MTLTALKRQNKKITCPIACASQLVGDTWVILIIRDLLGKPRRFGELQHSIIGSDCGNPINSRTLSQRLKKLESMNIITRKEFAHEMPPRVEYSLTKKGYDLSEIIEKIKEYGEKYF